MQNYNESIGNNILMRSVTDNDLEGSKEIIIMEQDESNLNNESITEIYSADKLYTEEDFENLPVCQNSCAVALRQFRETLSIKYSENSKIIKWTIFLIFLKLYMLFFIWSMVCKSKAGTLLNVEDNIRLIWLTCILILWIVYKIIGVILIKKKYTIKNPFKKPIWWDKFTCISFYVVIGSICLMLAGYIIFGLAIHTPYNLVSFLGTLSMLAFCYLFSNAPHMINWRTVLMGILLQFIFAFLILTSKPGYEVFKFIGDRVSVLLSYTDAGSTLVFGNSFLPGNFAFRILPMIVFLSSLISVLYYLGVIQVIIIALGTVMQKFMGTTCAESLNAAANIFLGMTEAPLLIKPYLGLMTNSELHAIMTGGFSTIAGTVLGAYIGYGAPANHLISASVMSAPAALAVSKIIYPETKKSKNTKDEAKKLIKSPHKNIVEAATAGASESIPLVTNIAVNLIAFVSILALFNAVLEWMGDRACMERKLTFELICSYLFWPLSLIMGVDIKDCRKVAELIGIKTFLNEFLAYEKLGLLMNNKKIFDSLNHTEVSVSYLTDNILVEFKNGTNLILNSGIIEAKRSIVITTYALCGFANFGSIGILLSTLSSMIPHRRADLSKMILRAMIAGNIACFLTACIAGLFYKE